MVYRTVRDPQRPRTVRRLYARNGCAGCALGGGICGDGKANPSGIVCAEEVKLAPVAKAGHPFCGWFDAETGGNEVTQIDESNILRLHNLYARFKENVYICEPSFSAAGGGIQN